jgi:hypothetical protein
MNSTVGLSFAVALILLVLCILIFASVSQHRANLGRWLIVVFGVLPGFVGVVYAFTQLFTCEDSAQSVVTMSPWLLLEMGALQLTRLVKRNGKVSDEPLNDGA